MSDRKEPHSVTPNSTPCLSLCAASATVGTHSRGDHLDRHLPLVAFGSFAIAPFGADWNPVLRAFVLTVIIVPVAVYLRRARLMKAYGKLRARRMR